MVQCSSNAPLSLRVDSAAFGNGRRRNTDLQPANSGLPVCKPITKPASRSQRVKQTDEGSLDVHDTPPFRSRLCTACSTLHLLCHPPTGLPHFKRSNAPTFANRPSKAPFRLASCGSRPGLSPPPPTTSRPFRFPQPHRPNALFLFRSLSFVLSLTTGRLLGFKPARVCRSHRRTEGKKRRSGARRFDTLRPDRRLSLQKARQNVRNA